MFPMKHKSEVFDCFTKFQLRAERFLNTKIVNIRTDNGMEFCHEKFNSFLSDQGIKHERTNVYTPQQNGLAEVFKLIALDGVKAMLNSSGLDNKFWVEALFCFVYVRNRICLKRDKTPFELYCGNKPSVKHLKVFGCVAYVGVPKQTRRKLDMRAKMGIMIGYAQKTRGYRIWLKDDRKVIETSNVTFDENLKGVEAVLGSKKQTVASTLR